MPCFSEAEITVRLVIADAPKRSEIRCVQGHMAFFGCDFCEVVGVSEKNPANTGSHRIWPAIELQSGHLALQRTHDRLLARAERCAGKSAEANIRDAGKNAGVSGRSPLFDLNGFDVIKDMIAESMHQWCEGVVKAILA